MEKFETLSKLEMGHVMGGSTSTQTEHSHLTSGWFWGLTGELDVERCGDAYADECCE
jgi:hypothetical protein